MSIRRYHDESLRQILHDMRTTLRNQTPGAALVVQVPHPDSAETLYRGETFSLSGQTVRYRPLSVWVELADILDCRLQCPKVLDSQWIELTMTPIDTQSCWHTDGRPSGHPEKYGIDTEYGRIDKFERPHDLAAFQDALEWIRLPDDAQVVSLGVNRGDELHLLWETLQTTCPPARLLGIDHSASAIEYARNRMPSAPFEFRRADLNEDNVLRGERFDAVLALNTLHSPKLDGRALLRRIVKDHLNPTGAIILGFPNCRYIGQTLKFGAQTKNYSSPEYSVLLKEISAYRRYLHQQKFTVNITGRHTLFVNAKRRP